MISSVEYLLDRLQIVDTMTAYCTAVDRKDWSKLETIFDDDAKIDYTATGGIAGDRGEAIAFLKEAMSLFSVTQHMVGNFEVSIVEGEANVRCILHNPMVMEVGDARDAMVFSVWYVVKLGRCGDAWKIVRLAQEAGIVVTGMPLSKS